MQVQTRTMRSLGYGLLVLCLMLSGAASIAYGITRNPSPPMPEAANYEPYQPPYYPAGTYVNAIGPSRPINLRIPDINVNTPLVNVGVNNDGTPGTPEGVNANKAAWLTTSPTPGTNGNSVIVGHVRTARGPSIFFNLGNLQPKQKIYVTRSDGSTAMFDVTAVRAYDKNAIPNDIIYAASGAPELRLITCGGNYDARNSYFSQNIIAFARFSGTL